MFRSKIRKSGTKLCLGILVQTGIKVISRNQFNTKSKCQITITDNGLKLLTIVEKISILDVCKGAGHASDCEKLAITLCFNAGMLKQNTNVDSLW